MKCACSLTPVLAIIGLVGLGIGGYNMARTGCPLGTCHEATTTVTPAAAVTSQGECPFAGCDGSAQVEVKSAALTEAPAPADCPDAQNCCTGKTEECCKGKSQSDCPMHAHDAAHASTECPHGAKPAPESGAN